MSTKHSDVLRNILHIWAQNYKPYNLIAKKTKTKRWTVQRTINTFLNYQTTAERTRSRRPQNTSDKNVEKRVI